MNIFNAAEAIDIGIEKEKARRDFYLRAAGHFREKKLKDLFSRLAEWEEGHIKKFTEIRRSVAQDETAESFPGEMGSYLKAVVDDKLYKEVSASGFARSVKTPLDAIRYGLAFERDAILFFSEISAVMEPHNKEAVERLVNEEKQHITYLAELKGKIA